MNKILSVCLLISICPSFVLGSCDDLNSPGQQDLTSQQQDISQEVQQNDSVITMTITEDFGKAENFSKIFKQTPNSISIKFPDFTQDGLLVPIGEILLTYLFEKDHRGTNNNSIQYVDSEVQRWLKNPHLSLKEKQNEINQLFDIFQPLQKIVENVQNLSVHEKNNLNISVSLNSNSDISIHRLFGLNKTQVNNFKYVDKSVTVNINGDQFFQNVNSLNLFASSLRETVNKWISQGYIDENKRLVYVIDKNLTSVTINKHIVELIPGVFSNCAALQKVQFEEGSQLQIIGGSAFSGCSSLKQIKIPDSVVFIGNQAFTESGLIQINLNQVNQIGPHILAKCPNLQIIWGNNIRYIPESMCAQCPNLQTVIIPKVQEIGDYAFCECPKLKHVVHVRKEEQPSVDLNVTQIGEGAFGACFSLTSVRLPNVKILSEGVFLLCTQLNNVYIPNVERINLLAFRGCSSLEKIAIQKVQILDDGAFFACVQLETIEGPHVKHIGNKCFKGCLKLTSVNFPELKTCGVFAFGASGLETFTMPVNLKKIPYGMFYLCPNLKEINFGKNVTEIRSNAFFGCSSLCKTTEQPDQWTNKDSSLLSGFIIPKQVEWIGKYAFCDCPGLKNVSISNKGTIYQGDSFANTTQVTGGTKEVENTENQNNTFKRQLVEVFPWKEKGEEDILRQVDQIQKGLSDEGI